MAGFGGGFLSLATRNWRWPTSELGALCAPAQALVAYIRRGLSWPGYGSRRGVGGRIWAAPLLTIAHSTVLLTRVPLGHLPFIRNTTEPTADATIDDQTGQRIGMKLLRTSYSTLIQSFLSAGPTDAVMQISTKL